MLSHGVGLAGLACLVLLLHLPISRLLPTLGTLCAAATLMLAGGRGPLLVFALVAVALILSAPRSARGTGGLVFGAMMALGATGATANEALSERFRLAAQQAAIGPAVIVEESVHARAALFDASLAAWSASPWVGHGRQHVMAATERHGAPHPSAYTHSHTHNALTNDLVAGGVPLLALYLALLCAPFALARGKGRCAFALAALGTSWFGLTGLSNIGFGHDATVGSFVALLAAIAAWPSARAHLD